MPRNDASSQSFSETRRRPLISCQPIFLIYEVIYSLTFIEEVREQLVEYMEVALHHRRRLGIMLNYIHGLTLEGTVVRHCVGVVTEYRKATASTPATYVIVRHPFDFIQFAHLL